MSLIDVSYFQKSKDYYFSLINKCIDNEEEKKLYFSRYENFINVYNSEMISYCINKYISAELDYLTPGERGLGRLSTYIPRFGAAFRKSLSKLNPDKLDKLSDLLVDLILRGYLLVIIFLQEKAEISKLTKEELFEEWIPNIYVVDLAQFPKSQYDMLSAACDDSFRNLLDFGNSFFSKKDMRNFKKPNFSEMIFRYTIAGLALRSIETPPEY